mmetsp:Transcript_25383/g.38495  ORF Transcript_25383/g.38495 Transcript_25383/m.38495 type:complete len:546 (+) Transcript_25383:119-1756(+)
MKLSSALIFFLGSVAAQAEGQAPPFRGLREIPHARILISDAILSSVHSDDGNISQEAFAKAVEAGIPADLIQNLAREAYQKVTEEGVPVKQIEDDMAALRKQEKEEQKQKQQPQYSGYQPKARWNMSTQAHVALSRAVMSGFRSPTHTIDPELVEAAEKEGVSPELIQESLDVMLKQRSKKKEEKDNKSEEVEKDEEDSDTKTPGQKFLPDTAIKALSRAVLSGYRSETGEVDPELMQQALDLGASKKEILESVKKMRTKKSSSKSLSSSGSPEESPNLRSRAHSPIQNDMQERKKERTRFQFDGNNNKGHLRSSKYSAEATTQSGPVKVVTPPPDSSGTPVDLPLDLIESIVDETVVSIETPAEDSSAVSVTSEEGTTVNAQPDVDTTVSVSSEEFNIDEFVDSIVNDSLVTVDEKTTVSVPMEKKTLSEPDTTSSFTHADNTDENVGSSFATNQNVVTHDELQKQIKYAELSRAAQRLKPGEKVDPKLVQEALDAGVTREQIHKAMPASDALPADIPANTISNELPADVLDSIVDEAISLAAP